MLVLIIVYESAASLAAYFRSSIYLNRGGGYKTRPYGKPDIKSDV